MIFVYISSTFIKEVTKILVRSNSSSSASLLFDREASQCTRADFLAWALVSFLTMWDHSFECGNGLLLLSMVKHGWIELIIGIWLMLSGLEHITLSFVTLIWGTRLDNTMSSMWCLLLLELCFHFTLLEGTAACSVLSSIAIELADGWFSIHALQFS